VSVLQVPEGEGIEERCAVKFEQFFVCEHGDTPERLVKAGIYRSSIAVPLHGGLHALAPTRDKRQSLEPATRGSGSNPR
jgi:hypothetical protein